MRKPRRYLAYLEGDRDLSGGKKAETFTLLSSRAAAVGQDDYAASPVRNQSTEWHSGSLWLSSCVTDRTHFNAVNFVAVHL